MRIAPHDSLMVTLIRDRWFSPAALFDRHPPVALQVCQPCRPICSTQRRDLDTHHHGCHHHRHDHANHHHRLGLHDTGAFRNATAPAQPPRHGRPPRSPASGRAARANSAGVLTDTTVGALLDVFA